VACSAYSDDDQGGREKIVKTEAITTTTTYFSHKSTMLPSIFRRRHEPEEITPIPGPLETDMPGLQHLQHLQQFEKAHKLDPNLPIDDLNDVDAAIATGNAEKGFEIEHALMEDNSPYPEV
jgi:hypothetical protein